MLSFESYLLNMLEKVVPQSHLSRMEVLLKPYIYQSSFLGASSRALAFLSKLGYFSSDEHHASQYVLKQLTSLGYDNLYLHNHEKFQVSSTDKLKGMILTNFIRTLGRGVLEHQFYLGEDRDKVHISIFRYTLMEESMFFVKVTTTIGSYWKPWFISSVFDFDCLLENFRTWFWGEVKNDVLLTSKVNNGVIEVVPVEQGHFPVDPFIGGYGPSEIFQYWDAFRKAGLPRSFLFVGAPGTGKTTTVRQIALDHNLRLAKISIEMFADDTMSEDFFNVWFNLLKPDILLFDDIHGISPSTGLSCMLSILEHINQAVSSETMVVATANRLNNVDLALRRPGRLDVTYSFSSSGFELPILKQYQKQYGAVLSLEESNYLVNKFKNLTPAYMKEIIKNLGVLQKAGWDDKKIWDFVDKRIELSIQLVNHDHDHFLTEVEKPRKSVGFLSKPERPY